MTLFLASLLLSGTVTVTLPMRADVRGTEVLLGEIAQVVGADPAEVELVAGIELGTAPAPGYSRLFQADKILEILSRKAPALDVRIVGQRACRVFPEVREISGEEILASARVQLERGFGTREASFEPNGKLPAVEVPAGAEAHTVRARLESLPSVSGLVSVPVDILVDGVRYRTVWTSWNVKLWKTLPVLARNVRSGQTLAPEHFERRRVLVSDLGGRKPLEPTKLLGSVAVHDLPAGVLVTGQDVHRPTVVQQGETLFLRVKKGPIEAKVSAIALEPGSVGDKVRVRTRDSDQELLALIVSRDVCELDLGQ